MKSESIAALAKALSAAQGEMTHATKDAENPAFKRGAKASTYADLASVIDAIREPFAKHGLSYVQILEPHDTRVIVTTKLMHESGQWIDSTISLPVASQTAHGYGSAITYARRYPLAAIAGISQADDDGNAASGKQEPAAPVHMDESLMANHRSAIEGADSLEALKTVWGDAVKAAGDDQDALRHLTAIKDGMKKKLAPPKEVK